MVKILIRLLIAVSLCMLGLAPTMLFSAQVSIDLGYAQDEISDDFVNAFMKDNPDIKLNRVDFSIATIMTRVAAGSPVNVWRGYGVDVPYFAEKGILLPIDDYCAKSKIFNASDFTPQANEFRYDVKTHTPFKGSLYGFPKDYSMVFSYFYRKDIWKSTGVEMPNETKGLSYEKFVDACKKMRIADSKGNTTRWGYDGVLGETGKAAGVICLADGNPIFSADNKKANIVGNKTLKQFFTMLMDLVNSKTMPSAISPGPEGAWLAAELANSADPKQQRESLYQYGYWIGATYQWEDEAAGKLLPGSSQVAMAPAPLWNGKFSDSTLGSTGFIIAKTGKKNIDDAAFRVLEAFAGNAPAGIDRAKSGWGLPALKSLEQLVPQKTVYDKQRLKVSLAQANDKRAIIPIGNMYANEPFSTAVGKYATDLQMGKMSIDEFLAKVQTETQSILDDGISKF